MYKRRYQSPVFMASSDGNTVIGDGTGQGTVAPEGMSYEECMGNLNKAPASTQKKKKKKKHVKKIILLG